MKRFLTAGIAAATLGASLAGTPAHAATNVMRVCNYTLNVTFDRVLDLQLRSGELTANYGQICTDIYDDGRIVGSTGGGTVSADFFGSCALLLFEGQIAGTMTGGAVLTAVDSDGQHLLSVAEWTVVPNSICSETSANGALGSFSAASVSFFNS